LFIPDARVLWVKPSVTYLKKYIVDQEIDTIITTGPPHSLHLIGLKLRQQLPIRWIADFRDQEPYGIPFRCLYSANIDNLLMAGKHISVTSVAASSVKFMGNGAQHGVAVAAAAFLCNEQNTTPRGLLDNHFDKLRTMVDGLTGHQHDMTNSPPTRRFVAVPS
jgi:hypothetical protein